MNGRMFGMAAAGSFLLRLRHPSFVTQTFRDEEMMIKELKTKSKHANPPLSFDGACRRYVEWAELEAAKHGEI